MTVDDPLQCFYVVRQPFTAGEAKTVVTRY